MNIFVKSSLWLFGIAVSIVGLWIMAMVGLSYTTNVTENNALWGGYQSDSEYILDRSVFVIKAENFINDQFVLVPEASLKRGLGRHHDAPNSFDDYRINPLAASIKKYDNFEIKIDVIGILEKGEKLKLYKLEKTNGWSLWFGKTTTLKPLAKVTSGKFQGVIVDITDISIYYRENDESPFLYKPELGVISKVTESNL